jgi:hypothetical protein
MKEVKNYVKAIISLLDEEQFFERAGIFMDRDIIEQFLIQTVSDNLEETGIPDLKPNQLEEVIDKTSKFIIEETFQDLLKEGKIVVAGVDENGEFLYASVEK